MPLAMKLSLSLTQVHKKYNCTLKAVRLKKREQYEITKRATDEKRENTTRTRSIATKSTLKAGGDDKSKWTYLFRSYPPISGGDGGEKKHFKDTFLELLA